MTGFLASRPDTQKTIPDTILMAVGGMEGAGVTGGTADGVIAGVT